MVSTSPHSASHRTIEPSVLYVGTPVYLVATKNPDQSVNLAPASSHFALGRTIVLGLEELGQSLANIRRHPEFTVNFLEASQWAGAERLSTVTGCNPVPAQKADQYLFESDKWTRANLSKAPAELVNVNLVAEAPINLECRALSITPSTDGVFGIVEAQVLLVHARQDITVADSNHLDPRAWHPLIYSYRHFFDRGDEVGWTGKSPLAQTPPVVERWERGGGTWEIVDTGGNTATLNLLQCDGGQVAETITLAGEQALWAKRQIALS